MHQICSIHWYLLCFSDNKILKTNPLSISLHLGYFITPFWFWKSYLSSENGSARTQSMFRVSTTRRRHLNTNQPRELKCELISRCHFHHHPQDGSRVHDTVLYRWNALLQVFHLWHSTFSRFKLRVCASAWGGEGNKGHSTPPCTTTTITANCSSHQRLNQTVHNCKKPGE